MINIFRKYMWVLLIIFSCKEEKKLTYIKIDNALWMQENLSNTQFQNGEFIPLIENSEEWAKTKTPAYTFYDLDNKNIAQYGLLYNWYAIADERGICPEGWKVPSMDDWNNLTNYAGGSFSAAQHLKSKKHWESPRDTILATYAFEALPGGNRKENGTFNGERLSAAFWTITEKNEEKAIAFYMNTAHSMVGNEAGDKRNALSCRCVKDL